MQCSFANWDESYRSLFYSPEIGQNDLLKMKTGFCHCLVGNCSVASPIVCRVSSESLSTARGARLTGLSFSPPRRPRTPSSSVPQECHRDLFCSPFHQQFPGMGTRGPEIGNLWKSFHGVCILLPSPLLTIDGESSSWTPNWVWTSSQISMDVPFGTFWK